MNDKSENLKSFDKAFEFISGNGNRDYASKESINDDLFIIIQLRFVADNDLIEFMFRYFIRVCDQARYEEDFNLGLYVGCLKDKHEKASINKEIYINDCFPKDKFTDYDIERGHKERFWRKVQIKEAIFQDTCQELNDLLHASRFNVHSFVLSLYVILIKFTRPPEYFLPKRTHATKRNREIKKLIESLEEVSSKFNVLTFDRCRELRELSCNLKQDFVKIIKHEEKYYSKSKSGSTYINRDLVGINELRNLFTNVLNSTPKSHRIKCLGRPLIGDDRVNNSVMYTPSVKILVSNIMGVLSVEETYGSLDKILKSLDLGDPVELEGYLAEKENMRNKY